MSSDGAIFVRRALLLLDRLRAGLQTTARWLAEVEEISEPTARRVIERLRWEYGAPIRWDARARSYALDDAGWRFPPAELTSTAELVALVYAVGMAGAIADPGLRDALQLLRARLGQTLGLDDEGVERLAGAYSSDRTDLAVFRDPAVKRTLEAISQGRRLSFTYSSPWSEEPPRRREVLPIHVRQMDGAVYLLSLESGQEAIFNLTFASALSHGERDEVASSRDALDSWRASFGVWYGEGQLEVRVTLRPPAARYYARQRWHAEQRDTLLEDGSLLRCFPAHPSPELRRRLLSLGPALTWVEPEALRAALRRDALALALRMDQDPPA